MKTHFQAVRLFLVLTILTGIIYPVLMTAAARIIFPKQANGSLIRKNGLLVGSELIAQKFQSRKYFWPRPSAADFSTIASGASNQGPTSEALKSTVKARRDSFLKENFLSLETNVPSEILFASGSGLDPHISPEAAKLQIQRVAKARNQDERILYRLVESLIEPPQYGIFGKPRVNVLRLNLALDEL